MPTINQLTMQVVRLELENQQLKKQLAAACRFEMPNVAFDNSGPDRKPFIDVCGDVVSKITAR